MLLDRAPYEPEPWRSRLANPEAFLSQPDAYDLLEKRPDIFATLRNTISITSLKGSDKVNVIPPEASAELDCRLLPGWTVERWVDQLRSVIGDPSIRIDVILNFPPATSSTDTPLFEAVQQTVHELDPGAGVVRSVSAGFTDSHFFREKGIVSYGFSAYGLTTENFQRVHGDNERIPVKNYTNGLHVLWGVVSDFSRAK